MDYQKDDKVVPCYAHESALAIAERTIKRLWITCMVLIALIVVTNAMWIMHGRQSRLRPEEEKSGEIAVTCSAIWRAIETC